MKLQWPQKKKVPLETDEYDDDLKPIELIKFKDGKYGIRTNPLMNGDNCSLYFSMKDKVQFRDSHEIALYCKMDLIDAENMYKSLLEVHDVEIIK